jgi:hypothetical protein
LAELISRTASLSSGILSHRVALPVKAFLRQRRYTLAFIVGLCDSAARERARDGVVPVHRLNA